MYSHTCIYIPHNTRLYYNFAHKFTLIALYAFMHYLVSFPSAFSISWTVVLLIQRRQWHPIPVLLPGKSHGRRDWWAAVHGVAKSQTRLSDFTFTFLFPALEKEMATHSSVLAWRIPGTGESGGLSSMGSHRVVHDWSDLAAAAAALYHEKMFIAILLK